MALYMANQTVDASVWPHTDLNGLLMADIRIAPATRNWGNVPFPSFVGLLKNDKKFGVGSSVRGFIRSGETSRFPPYGASMRPFGAVGPCTACAKTTTFTKIL